MCDNIQTTIPMIQTTIPIIQTTNPKIHTTIPMIQTTIPMIQTTTIPKIQTTFPQIPKIQSEETVLILFGFNYFRLSSSTMSFNVLFAQVLNEIYTNSIKVALIINYDENIRILEEKEIDCYLKKKNNKIIVPFFCQTEIKNSNIKKVEIVPKFNFINQNKVRLLLLKSL